MATRQGLNGTFTYTLPSGSLALTYQVRVLAIGYGSQQLASEQMSRTRRAFYPRNVVPTMISIQIILVGTDERSSFSNFIQDYATQYLSPQSGFPPIMTFTCPAMDLIRTGIPTQGFEWGNNVGGMVWTPTILLQVTDPTATPVGPQRTGGSGFSDLDQASYQQVIKNSPEVKYFIPEGIQLTGDQAPPDGAWSSGTGISSAGVDLLAGGAPPPSIFANPSPQQKAAGSQPPTATQPSPKDTQSSGGL